MNVLDIQRIPSKQHTMPSAGAKTVCDVVRINQCTNFTQLAL